MTVPVLSGFGATESKSLVRHFNKAEHSAVS